MIPETRFLTSSSDQTQDTHRQCMYFVSASHFQHLEPQVFNHKSMAYSVSMLECEYKRHDYRVAINSVQLILLQMSK